MRRTQLFLDDPLWEALHARARSEKTTISELVRQAARQRYLGSQEARMAAMQSFVGSRKSRARSANSSEEIREMRRGSRLDRLGGR
jgi:predicted DNA-binding ribbon-helix-helix protein